MSIVFNLNIIFSIANVEVKILQHMHTEHTQKPDNIVVCWLDVSPTILSGKVKHILGI